MSANDPPILDYAPIATKRWATLLRRAQRPFLIIVLGMLLGACVAWAVSPATRYRTTAIFRADPRGRATHGTQQERDDFVREWREIETAAFATLRSPDLPDIALNIRGSFPTSMIQTSAQLHEHLAISFVPDTHLIQVGVEDVSQSGANQTLEAYVAAAKVRIGLAGPSELIEERQIPRIQTSDHRRSWFAATGAALSAFATIGVLLLKSRSLQTVPTPTPPLQRAPSP